MRLTTVFKIFSVMLLIYAGSLISVMVTSLVVQDGYAHDYFIMILFATFAGLVMGIKSWKDPNDLKPRQSFILVTLMWVVFSLLNALPFMLITGLSFDEAIFETISGLTTAGGTVFNEIDTLPASILLFRSQLQWLGGMGIIVLMVAVFPLLNIGGMRLFKAETPGPIKDEKMTPRIAHTARYLWIIYVGFTLACAVSFHLAGMSWFDAFNHAMTAISTGGFSTHTASFAWFDSVTIEMIASFFMLAGSINFAVHFVIVRELDLKILIRDEESRVFFLMVILAVVIVALTLFFSGTYQTIADSFRFATFEVVSIVSSTGFGLADFTEWPLFIPAFLMLISYVGGCAGSTAGGMKVIRIVVVLKGIGQQIRLLMHPQGIFRTTFNQRKVRPDIQQTIFAFLFIYTVTAMLFMLLLLLTGVDYLTAFGAVTACINVLGPGLGEVASSFHSLTPVAKLLLSLLMLIGRLEVFTVFVLMSPLYWKSAEFSRQNNETNWLLPNGGTST